MLSYLINNAIKGKLVQFNKKILGKTHVATLRTHVIFEPIKKKNQTPDTKWMKNKRWSFVGAKNKVQIFDEYMSCPLTWH